MDRGIWAISYELPEGDKSEYLAWFHDVHIPEKLLRPGYLWAAHYDLGHGGHGKGYLALFGAGSAHTFLNPSPGQLAQRQSAESGRMMAMRQQSFACILVEETRVDGPEASKRGPGMTPGPVVQMGNYNAASPAVEDDLGAWYAQERLPLLAKLPGCIGARKLLAAVGAYKHAILHEFASLELRERHFGPHEADARNPDTWMGRVRPHLTHAPRSPAVGRRIWPALDF
ncbi:MAG: hypothetical protein FJY54_09615 [Betaproteobacteria bacterium]|nr:hypothetical protein [Betaproteobacteria bacterium]